MNVAGEKTIKILYVKLKNTSAADKIADYLYSKDIVSFETLTDIHSRPTDYKKWEVILSVVLKSEKTDTFGIFVDAIEKADESLEGLATELRDTYSRLVDEVGTTVPQACTEGHGWQETQGRSRNLASATRNSDSSSDSDGDDLSNPLPDQLSLDNKPDVNKCAELGITSKLASEWYTFAIYLGLEEEVDQIDSDYRKVQNKCEEAVKMWIRGKGSQHFKERVTWRALLGVVKKIYPAFADELREKFEFS